MSSEDFQQDALNNTGGIQTVKTEILHVSNSETTSMLQVEIKSERIESEPEDTLDIKFKRVLQDEDESVKSSIPTCSDEPPKSSHAINDEQASGSIRNQEENEQNTSQANSAMELLPKNTNKNDDKITQLNTVSLLDKKDILKCSVCPYQNKSNENMTKHEKLHAREILYVCDHCGYGSNGRTGMANHMRRHTVQKVHMCPLCDRKYMFRSCLTTHLRYHYSTLKALRTIQNIANLNSTRK